MEEFFEFKVIYKDLVASEIHRISEIEMLSSLTTVDGQEIAILVMKGDKKYDIELESYNRFKGCIKSSK